jgi:hypothetical protein
MAKGDIFERYTLDRIGDYEAEVSRIKAELEADMRGAGGVGRQGLPRYERVLQLLKLGIEPALVDDGLLINDRIVIAVHKNRYRYCGRYKWYWFSSLEQVCGLAREAA